MSDNLRIAHNENPTVFPWIALKPLAAAPSPVFPGMLALADFTNWDPLSSADTKPYLVLYDGTAWIAPTDIA